MAACYFFKDSTEAAKEFTENRHKSNKKWKRYLTKWNEKEETKTTNKFKKGGRTKWPTRNL
jgi:hypothetical protein